MFKNNNNYNKSNFNYYNSKKKQRILHIKIYLEIYRSKKNKDVKRKIELIYFILKKKMLLGRYL